MDILYNNNLIDEIVDKLFRHKRVDYSEFNLEHLLFSGDISHEVHQVTNPNFEKLYASLFTKEPNPQVCIVFMHGYGSNRLECINVLKAMPANYALCAFDFSGSGKSEGDRITYGMKQKEDINSIINFLRQLEFKRFILWGRSMGATSALLYCLKYNPSDVILQVIDSPFYSFELIAFEIASKNVKAPEFIISFALQLAKKNCSKFQYNPFAIELKEIGQCSVSALFLYHEEDSVINCQNTHLICSKYKATFQKLAIDQNHNTIRSHRTIQKIFTFIEKYSKKSKPKVAPILISPYFESTAATYKNGYTTPRRKFASREADDGSEKRSAKKGIERVDSERGGKKVDDYNMWLKSKFNTEMINTPPLQSTIIKRKEGTPKRTHLSLSNPSSTKNSRGLDPCLTPSLLKEMSGFSQMTQFNAKTMASEKQRRSKKLTTVKYLGVSRCVHFQRQV